MAKKHLILIASVAAGMAIAAPVAMAAPLPELPGLPAAPIGAPNSGDCSTEPGAASAQSDQPALQLPVGGLNDLNEGNCQSAGNDQGNGVGGGMGGAPSLPGLPH